MRDEAGIVGTAPTFDVARELGTLYGIAWWRTLGRVECLV
jgi:hypothetical protein